MAPIPTNVNAMAMAKSSSISVTVDKERVYYHLSFVTDIGRKNGASVAILVYAMQYLMERFHLNYFILGGGNTNSPNDSLYLFKMDFANKSLPYYILKAIFNKDIYLDWLRNLKKVHDDRFIFYR